MNIKKLLLSVILSLCFVSPVLATVDPDTTSKAVAIQLAQASRKMILLIVSDTNSCSGCITLEFSSLPTTKPPIKQMISESFVYWACGGEIKGCKDYTNYTGTGIFPLPAYFIIDPTDPNKFRSSGYGGGDPVTFFNFLSRGLLKATYPQITRVSSVEDDILTPKGCVTNLVVNSNLIYIDGRSFSTNVTLRQIKYSVNNGPWATFTVTNHLTWTSLPVHLVKGTNNVRFYANDISVNYLSRTNNSSFIYVPLK